MGLFDYSLRLFSSGGSDSASPIVDSTGGPTILTPDSLPSSAEALSALKSGAIDLIASATGSSTLSPNSNTHFDAGMGSEDLNQSGSVAQSGEALSSDSPSTYLTENIEDGAWFSGNATSVTPEIFTEWSSSLMNASQTFIDSMAASVAALANVSLATLQGYNSGLESVCNSMPGSSWWNDRAMDVGLDPSTWPPLVPSWASGIEGPSCESSLNGILLLTILILSFQSYYQRRQVSPAHISTVPTKFNRRLLKKLTALKTPYKPPYWMSCGHATTIFGPVWVKPTGYPLPWVLELRRTPDLGVYTLTTLTPEAVRANDPARTTIVDAPHKSALPPMVVVIHHGVGGDYQDYYICRLARRICLEKNAHVIVHNIVGRAGAPLPYARVTGMNDTRDMYRTYDTLCERYPGIPIFSVGFSFGAGQLSSYLCQKGSHAPQTGAVLIAPPLDPAPNIHFLTDVSKIGRWVYSRVMVTSLFKHFNKHRRVFDEVEIPGYYYEKAAKATTFWDFDNHITAPIGGYKDARAYYKDAATLHKLVRVRVPTLVVVSKDDPVTINPPDGYDFLDNPMIITAFTKRGGHCAYPQGRFSPSENNYWSDNAILNWLDAVRETGTELGYRLRRPDNLAPFFKPKHPYAAAKRAAADDLHSTGRSLHHQAQANRRKDMLSDRPVGVPPSMPSLHSRSSARSAGSGLSDRVSVRSDRSAPTTKWKDQDDSMSAMSARSTTATAGSDSLYGSYDAGAGASPPPPPAVSTSMTFGEPPVGSRARSSSTSVTSPTTEPENVVAEMRRMQRVLHGLRTELGVLIPSASKALSGDRKSSSKAGIPAPRPHLQTNGTGHGADGEAQQPVSPTAAQLESVLSDMRRDLGEGLKDLNLPVPEVPNASQAPSASAAEYSSFGWSLLKTGFVAGASLYLANAFITKKKPNRR